MHHHQPFPPQPLSVAEYTFPSVLQFLQTEWRRFERDRNEWDIEKSEMKARIAFLEGEKRGVETTKVDLMKRVKMLEYALRQERSKYVEASASMASAAVKGTASASGVTIANGPNVSTPNRMSTYSLSGQNMAQTSPTSATCLDALGRAKSREFLRVCLQEISYLTASVPQSIATNMPPAPSRLTRQESDRRPPVAASSRAGTTGATRNNRNSDFYPTNSNAHPAAPPPAARSNSVPLATLKSLAAVKSVSGSPPLDLETDSMTGPLMEDKAEDATLKQFVAKPMHPASPPHGKERQHRNSGVTIPSKGPSAASGVDSTVPLTKSVQEKATDWEKNRDSSTTSSPKGLSMSETTAGEEDEPITVVHSPISDDHWFSQLRKAGQQLVQNARSKPKAEPKAEEESQLAKNIQDEYNIPQEKLDKMVKDWDKSKEASSSNQTSIRKKRSKDTGMLDELANLSINDNETTEDTTRNGESANEPARWRPKLTLRRHMDTVRSVAFHPRHKAIISGSEDGTMKYWNLENSLGESRRSGNGEIEPIHTYRGHTKAITTVVVSSNQETCFSASMDSTIRGWKLVPLDKETYSRTDPSLAVASFVGHTDVVWDIRLFPLAVTSSLTSQLLASISADGTLKIWDTAEKMGGSGGSPLRASWDYHGLDGSLSPSLATVKGKITLPVPTSLDFCPTDLKKMVVSYSNSVMRLFDIETGKEILTFKSNETYDGTKATQINKVICHPTLPVVMSGHEDRYIRFFDVNSGACSFSMLSHLDAVSSLDVDPSGLVLCSGGHDGSVRMWDIGSPTRACLQEFTGHRRKAAEGVCSVQYHPTLSGLMATGGADSIVKVYTRS